MSDAEKAPANQVPAGIAASVGDRVGAVAFDTAITCGITAAILILPFPLDPMLDWIWENVVLLIVVVPIAYYTVTEILPRRESPGKRVFGLVVLDREGELVDRTRATTRLLLTVICALTVLAPLVALALPRRRGIPDVLTGTTVVRVETLELEDVFD